MLHDRRVAASTAIQRITRRRATSRGQSLVEFAMVFPIFVVLLMGIIEFAFVFNALLGINFASRDAALAGAEAGDTLGADCVILKAVDDAVGAPSADDRIVSVAIYRANSKGTLVGSPTVYNRGGSTSCSFIDGTTSTQAYTRSANGYPETDRCNILVGCDATRTTVDNIGVRITYTHGWVTPIRNFIGGGSGGMTFDRSSVMRMEPVL